MVIKTMKNSVHKVLGEMQSIAERVRELKDRLIVGQQVVFKDLLDKTEGSGVGYFINKAFRGELGTVTLFVQEVVIAEFDGAADFKPAIGFNSDGFVTLGERDRLGDAEDFAQSPLFFEPAFFKEVNEWTCAAVHDGYFV